MEGDGFVLRLVFFVGSKMGSPSSGTCGTTSMMIHHRNPRLEKDHFLQQVDG